MAKPHITFLKGQCHEIFQLQAFSWISFPQALKYPSSVIKFFLKFAEIFADQGAPPVSLTQVANGKIFNQKSFNCFIWTPMGCRANIKINFILQVHLLPVSLTPVANLPPLSLIPVVHLDLRLSPRIFEKIEQVLTEYSGTGGKLIREKNQKQKISWHLPVTKWNFTVWAKRKRILIRVKFLKRSKALLKNFTFIVSAYKAQ
jgi:hypothetical protein